MCAHTHTLSLLSSIVAHFLFLPFYSSLGPYIAMSFVPFPSTDDSKGANKLPEENLKRATVGDGHAVAPLGSRKHRLARVQDYLDAQAREQEAMEQEQEQEQHSNRSETQRRDSPVRRAHRWATISDRCARNTLLTPPALDGEHDVLERECLVGCFACLLCLRRRCS